MAVSKLFLPTLLNTPRKIYLYHSLEPTQVKSAIKKNINGTSTSCTRLTHSCPNWHVTSLFELYLCFVAGHVPYKFQRNPVSSIRNHNSWPNANPYLNAHHHINYVSTYLNSRNSIKHFRRSSHNKPFLLRTSKGHN